MYTNTSDVVTHVFYARNQKCFRDFKGLKTLDDYYVKYDERYFEIHRIENYNEKNKWLVMRMIERGPSDFGVNTT